MFTCLQFPRKLPQHHVWTRALKIDPIDNYAMYVFSVVPQSVDPRPSCEACLCRAECIRCQLSPDARSELRAAGHEPLDTSKCPWCDDSLYLKKKGRNACVTHVQDHGKMNGASDQWADQWVQTPVTRPLASDGTAWLRAELVSSSCCLIIAVVRGTEQTSAFRRTVTHRRKKHKGILIRIDNVEVERAGMLSWDIF